MSIYGLEIKYNGKPPMKCYSRERGGVSAHLYTMKGGLLRLDVSCKSPGQEAEYSLPALVPGDRLSFKFLQRARPGVQSMSKLPKLARKPVTWRKTPRFRLGLDLRLKTGETVRTSLPQRGGFSFMLCNIPLDHARAFVMAWNRQERWHWQLTDLYPDEEVSFHIVETDWCDEASVTNLI